MKIKCKLCGVDITDRGGNYCEFCYKKLFLKEKYEQKEQDKKEISR